MVITYFPREQSQAWLIIVGMSLPKNKVYTAHFLIRKELESDHSQAHRSERV